MNSPEAKGAVGHSHGYGWLGGSTAHSNSWRYFQPGVTQERALPGTVGSFRPRSSVSRAELERVRVGDTVVS